MAVCSPYSLISGVHPVSPQEVLIMIVTSPGNSPLVEGCFPRSLPPHQVQKRQRMAPLISLGTQSLFQGFPQVCFAHFCQLNFNPPAKTRTGDGNRGYQFLITYYVPGSMLSTLKGFCEQQIHLSIYPQRNDLLSHRETFFQLSLTRLMHNEKIK
jgi:hypothetical protein